MVKKKIIIILLVVISTSTSTFAIDEVFNCDTTSKGFSSAMNINGFDMVKYYQFCDVSELPAIANKAIESMELLIFKEMKLRQIPNNLKRR